MLDWIAFFPGDRGEKKKCLQPPSVVIIVGVIYNPIQSLDPGGVWILRDGQLLKSMPVSPDYYQNGMMYT